MFKSCKVLHKEIFKISQQEKSKLFQGLPGNKLIKEKYQDLRTDCVLVEKNFLIFNPSSKSVYLKEYKLPDFNVKNWIGEYKKIVLDVGNLC